MNKSDNTLIDKHKIKISLWIKIMITLNTYITVTISIKPGIKVMLNLRDMHKSNDNSNGLA